MQTIHGIWHQLGDCESDPRRFRAIGAQNIVQLHGTLIVYHREQVWPTFTHRRASAMIRHIQSSSNQERPIHADRVSMQYRTRRSISETLKAAWCWNTGAFRRNLENWLRPAFCLRDGPPSVPPRARRQGGGKWSKWASL
jgi:hypothetical protein